MIYIIIHYNDAISILFIDIYIHFSYKINQNSSNEIKLIWDMVKYTLIL